MNWLGFVLSTQYSVRSCRAASWLFVAILAGSASAQVDRSIALPPADVEQLDASSAAHLENAKRFLAERQWSEAVESLRRVQETEPTRLVKVETTQAIAGFERYVTAAEYCQWRLAALAAEAPEALPHYRRLVDSLAEAWLREGEKTNDERLLRRIVEQAFASRSGDDALLRLGDLALARGDYSAARAAWHQINANATVPPSAAKALNAAAGAPLWQALRRIDMTAHGSEVARLLRLPRTPVLGIYPDSDIDPAAVHARMALGSILEGSRERATIELAILRLLYPDAVGQLAGRSGRYSDMLGSLLEESAAWPAVRQSADWPTFAGDASRAKSAAAGIDLSPRPLWTYPLPRLSADREWIGAGRLRAAEDTKSLLGYHPVVVGQKVILRLDAGSSSRIVALDLKTGERLWQVDPTQSSNRPVADDAVGSVGPIENDAHRDLARHIGVARYTVSAEGDKLFARMGSPITVPSSRRAALWLAKDQGYLLGVDLRAQGKPLEGFPIRPQSNEWTFEGTPVGDSSTIYVAMRRVEGARSQLFLAAFELPTTPVSQPDERDENARPTGRLKWRTRICSSATLGGGEIDQLTHLLVTLADGRLFLNTSAGAVAAVNADDGRLQWLVKYPRTRVRTGNPDQPERHLFRDLTPCVAWGGLVIVAPADSDRLFALEAATGQLAWSLPPGAADDAVHLLGASNDTLLVSGDSLYWIDVYTGRLMAQFPRGRLGGAEQAAPSPRGFGRGALVGDRVWWPTRESLYIFEARPATTDFGLQPRMVKEIPLLPRGTTGGNLVFAGGVLLIANGNKLVAFERHDELHRTGIQ
jgi:outer membrane protein assembly factor BamB